MPSIIRHYDIFRHNDDPIQEPSVCIASLRPSDAYMRR